MPLSSSKDRQPGQRIAPTVIDKRATVRLRLARRRAKVSQVELQQMLAQRGYIVSRQLLGKLESGDTRMSIGQAHLLGQLLTGDEAILIRDDLSLARDCDSGDGEEG
tara:strand:- start:30498 stop:30818 length:321 start_codon:yes stop_codon:yes gene_type:complete